MKISYNWLKQYLSPELKFSAEEIAKILTDTGLEVESITPYESIKGGLEGVVVGQVLTCEKHPNADKLSVTTVDVGQSEALPIVCGAPNVAAGQKVVVATVGATLYPDEKGFTIKKAKIRGQLSQGMICAEDELGIGTSHDGIMVLPETLNVGTPAADYFNVERDVVFEIGLTPNRIDGASHIGTARDLIAYFKYRHFINKQAKNFDLKNPLVDHFTIDNAELLPIEVIVENTEACPRYSGLTISGIKVAESPQWLQHKLKALDMKPINNIVDITNYVLHELGQPLHAFDAKAIAGNKVIVKTLAEGSTFVTLDEQQRRLSDQDLMICNAKEGMCIAGVFGGMHSGVTEQTTAIFLESAYFNPVWIRKTARRHALATDASFRFERGADPLITIYALKRAALMIKEIAGGHISSEIVDVYPQVVEPNRIRLEYDYLDRLIGERIDRAAIAYILEVLDFEIASDDPSGLDLLVPSYRVDVLRQADVVEELLRIYGYNTVPIPQQVKSAVVHFPKPNRHAWRNTAANMLTSNGFNEAMSNSLTKSAYYDDCPDFPKETVVNILNPLSNDLNAMRQNLLFGLLEAVAHNQNYKQYNLKLYEFGNSYHLKTDQKQKDDPASAYEQTEHLAMIMTGQNTPESWHNPVVMSDFFTLKAYVELLLRKLHFTIDDLQVSETEKDIFSYGIEYQLNNKCLIICGAVAKKWRKPFDIEGDVFYADLNWDIIMANLPGTPKFKALPKYPAVKRDLALLLDQKISFSKVKEIAFKTENKLLKSLSLFDVYQGDKIETGKKSYAISFILQDENKTLTDKQIDKSMSKLMKAYQAQLSATIR